MNILFIGVAATEEVLKESDEKYNEGKNSIRPQQHFDFKLIEGLANSEKIKAISEPPIASYPKSKCFFYPLKNEKISENLEIEYIALINLIIIKTIIISFSIFFKTLRYIKEKNKNNIVIILGYISFYTFFPVYILSKFYNLKILVVVPDIPSYVMNYSKIKNNFKKLIWNLYSKLDRIIEKYYDGYILLTEHMNEIVNKRNKAYIVVEGFISLKEIKILKKNKKKTTKKIIMYAGTIHEKYGIKKLIKAFKKVNVLECELWIFGEGDSLEFIKNEEKIDSRIRYKGTKTKEEILELEKQVSLLINPRPTTEEFTKYSFPSKTLEYMASGTPLLTTKLAGIPKEYFKYIYTFENEDIYEMSKKIEEIILKSDEELIKFGKTSQKFVFKNKTIIEQSKRILDFIKFNI